MAVLLTQASLRDDLPGIDGTVVAVDEIWAGLDTKDQDPPGYPADPANLSHVIYTSGSTGRPKGVAVCGAGVVKLQHWARSVFNLKAGDGVLASTSICFDLSVFEIFGTLASGAAVILADNALHLASLEARQRVTLINTVPSAMVELLRLEAVPASVRTVNLAGEPLRATLVKQIYQLGSVRGVYNLYGPSEDTTYSTFGLMQSSISPNIGRPLAGKAVYLVDAFMNLIPAGVAGELCLGGHGLARGYLGRAGLSAQRFVPDPFSGKSGARLYRTGDLARLLPNGELDFLGRLDHQVKLNGFRIELGEIEAVLDQFDTVAESVLMVRRDGNGAQRLTAYIRLVVTADQTAFSIQPLRDYLKSKLPGHMIPGAFVVLEEFPLTPNGKLDRAAFPAPDGSTALADRGFTPPTTETQKRLAVLWEDILGVAQIGVHDHFFERGGHSLLATRVVSHIRQRFQRDLPLSVFFQMPTIAEQAAYLDDTAAIVPSAEAVQPAPARGGRPLSASQLRLWILQRYQPTSGLYNMPGSIRVKGALDRNALCRALEQLSSRQPSLRTVFRMGEADLPEQVVLDTMTPHFTYSDESGTQTADLKRLINREAEKPFDLESGPLFRAHLMKRGEDDHVLLFIIHHIVSDGWSQNLLLRDWMALYGWEGGGVPAGLPDLDMSYLDFSVWQRNWLESDSGAEALNYWRHKLHDAPWTLELPLDYVRPPVRGTRGADLELELEADTYAQISALARERGGGAYMTLLAAFGVLLSRLAGQETVLVGSPIANRNRVETENLVGFFVNTLVLRMDTAPDLSFRQFLDQVRDTTQEAYTHQDVPFEKLLEVLNPERDLSRTPLVQVFFNMLNIPEMDQTSTGDLALETFDGADELTANFDITLYVKERDGRLFLRLVYATDLFEPEHMRSFIHQYAHVLRQVGRDPDRPLADYSLVPPLDVNRLPNPADSLNGDWCQSIHDRLTLNAVRQPEAIALWDGATSWTYADVEKASNRLARHLRDQGVDSGDRVVIYAHRSAPLVVAVMGVLKAGAVFMCMDPAYPEQRLLDCMEPAAPTAAVRVQAAGPLPPRVARLVDGMCTEVVLGPGRQTTPDLAALDASPLQLPVGPHDIAYISFTSGSTGKPKGIEGRHGSLTHFMDWQVKTFALRQSDCFSLCSGLAHDPLQRDIFTAFWVGGRIAIPDGSEMGNPGWLAAWMAEAGVTVTHLTPAMGQILTDGVEAGGLPALRRAFFVGDVLTRAEVSALRQSAPNVEVVNFYGSTETQRAVGYHFVEEADMQAGRVRESIPLGRGVEDAQLLVLNAQGRPAGVGEVGEIHLRSHFLAGGYLDNASLTAEKFIQNPFRDDPRDRLYRTDDRGSYLANGEVIFQGRADQQVKVRGYRVELKEIEAALLRCEKVRDVCVVQRADFGKRLAAYIVGDVDKTALRTYMLETLPEFMVPSAFIPLQKIPLTPNGKLDRRALPAVTFEDLGVTGRQAAPQTDAEKAIVHIWCEVLGLERVGVNDSFFDLGGNSLLATRVMSRIHGRFSINPPLRTFFEGPTIAQLARVVSQTRAETEGPPRLEKAPRGSAVPLSLSQKRLWVMYLADPDSPLYNISMALKVSGPFQPETLQTCFNTMLSRHEILRARFVDRDKGGEQTFVETPDLDIPIVNLEGEAGETTLKTHLDTLAREPFDFERRCAGSVARVQAKRHPTCDFLQCSPHHF